MNFLLRSGLLTASTTFLALGSGGFFPPPTHVPLSFMSPRRSDADWHFAAVRVIGGDIICSFSFYTTIFSLLLFCNIYIHYSLFNKKIVNIKLERMCPFTRGRQE